VQASFAKRGQSAEGYHVVSAKMAVGRESCEEAASFWNNSVLIEGRFLNVFWPTCIFRSESARMKPLKRS